MPFAPSLVAVLNFAAAMAIVLVIARQLAARFHDTAIGKALAYVYG